MLTQKLLLCQHPSPKPRPYLGEIWIETAEALSSSTCFKGISNLSLTCAPRRRLCGKVASKSKSTLISYAHYLHPHVKRTAVALMLLKTLYHPVALAHIHSIDGIENIESGSSEICLRERIQMWWTSTLEKKFCRPPEKNLTDIFLALQWNHASASTSCLLGWKNFGCFPRLRWNSIFTICQHTICRPQRKQ